jgi:hypothetical protein
LRIVNAYQPKFQANCLSLRLSGAHPSLLLLKRFKGISRGFQGDFKGVSRGKLLDSAGMGIYIFLKSI